MTIDITQAMLYSAVATTIITITVTPLFLAVTRLNTKGNMTKRNLIELALAIIWAILVPMTLLAI